MSRANQYAINQSKNVDVFSIPGLQSRVFALSEIRAAFDAMDFDKNGCLDDADIRNLLLLTGESATEEELQEMLRMVDHDGTGVVSFDEFAQLFLYPDSVFVNTELVNESFDMIKSESFQETESTQTKRMIMLTDLTSSGSMSLSSLKIVFSKFEKADVHHSGRIDYTSFLSALSRSDSPCMQRMFRAFDSDGSGEVDFREFAMGLSTLTTGSLKEKVNFAFKLFDTDESGFIERPELVSIIRASLKIGGSSSSDDLLGQKIESLYAALGVPKDSPLTQEKFLALANLDPFILQPALAELDTLGNSALDN